MGPTWGRQDPGGPHVGPMNLAIREISLAGQRLLWVITQTQLNMSYLGRHLWLWFLYNDPNSDPVTLHIWCIYARVQSRHTDHFAVCHAGLHCFTGNEWVSARIITTSINKLIYTTVNISQLRCLPHSCDWLRSWHVACWYQASNWTNVNLSSKVFCGIHLRAILQKMIMNLIYNTWYEITLSKLFSQMPMSSNTTDLCNFSVRGYKMQSSPVVQYDTWILNLFHYFKTAKTSLSTTAQEGLTFVCIIMMSEYCPEDLWHIPGPISICGCARFQPMIEDITYVTSSLISWDLALPWIENVAWPPSH